MPLLHDILSETTITAISGQTDRDVTGLCIDSRAVAAGNAFIALRGIHADGHAFIEKAVALGATTIVCEIIPPVIHTDVTYVQVPDSHTAAGRIASAFYHHPSHKMKVTGITGTNGKTTTATLLFGLFQKLGYKCGLISTVQNHIDDRTESATHTTPDAVSIHRLLARMHQAGCTHVFMEVSSHAIHQRRIEGIEFAGGVFTNITHDHLDYHQTFDEYIRVKKIFFDNLPVTAFALTNTDDKRGMVMLQNTQAKKYTYSLRVPATFKGKVLENNLSGLVMQVDDHEIHFRITGTFNAYNIMAAYGAAMLLGQEDIQSLSVLSDLKGAPGRFETYLSDREKVLGIVDYAHTPDALLNVLATINQLRTGQQLITVTGCGGDRDKIKRPVMAEVACTHSDRVILTSDNPRNEDPETILDDMEKGINVSHRRKVLRITDRKEAIKTACTLAQPGDIVLVAGKGHETYQEITGVRYPFDDRAILLETFKLLDK